MWFSKGPDILIANWKRDNKLMPDVLKGYSGNKHRVLGYLQDFEGLIFV